MNKDTLILIDFSDPSTDLESKPLGTEFTQKELKEALQKFEYEVVEIRREDSIISGSLHEVAGIVYHGRSRNRKPARDGRFHDEKDKLDELQATFEKKRRCLSFHHDRNVNELVEEIRHRFSSLNQLSDEILRPFLSLHLSLQAFFGISKDDSDRWIKIRDAKEIEEEWRERFPVRDIFLLAGEDQSDVHLVLGSRLGPIDPSAQFKSYRERPLLNLVEELFSHEGILSYRGYKDEHGVEIDGTKLKDRINQIILNEDLRTLCTALANIKTGSEPTRVYEQLARDLEARNQRDHFAETLIDEVDFLAGALKQVAAVGGGFK